MAIELASLVSRLTPNAGAAPLNQVPMLEVTAPGTGGGEAGASAFHAVLAEAVGRVESFHATSQTSIAQFLNGADVDLHQVALDVQKAETSFELFAEVRNKVVQAYQEIMRLQV